MCYRFLFASVVGFVLFCVACDGTDDDGAQTIRDCRTTGCPEGGMCVPLGLDYVCVEARNDGVPVADMGLESQDASEQEPDMGEPEPELDMGEPEPEPDMGEPEPEPDMGEPEPEPDMGEPEPEPDMGEPEPEPDMGEPEPEPEPDMGEPEPEPDMGPPDPEPEPEPDPVFGPGRCDHNRDIEGNDQFDPNQDQNGARQIQPGEYEGLIIHGDESDWYRLEVCAGGLLTVSVSHPFDGGDMDLQVWLDNERVIHSEAFCSGVEGGAHRNVADVPHDAIIGVYPYGPPGMRAGDNTYTMRVEVDCP